MGAVRMAPRVFSKFLRIADGPAAAWPAAGMSLTIGLLFVFVRAPHPWGWEGMDQYRELGLASPAARSSQPSIACGAILYFLAAAASARRLLRMFVISGSEDPSQTAQFDSSRLVYRAATALMLVFVAKTVVSVAQRISSMRASVPERAIE